MTDPDAPLDPLLADVARTLRKPVPIAGDLDRRVLEEIKRPARRRSRAWPLVALAAGIAAVAVLLGRPPQENSSGVAFTLEAPDARRVTLVGDFNDWDPDATPLTRTGDPGAWETTLPLPPGRYEFTFVVDGQRWVADPALPKALGDDFGRPTSVITVGERSRT